MHSILGLNRIVEDQKTKREAREIDFSEDKKEGIQKDKAIVLFDVLLRAPITISVPK